ncbi:hypothetical protein NIA69_05955 [Gemmiger formicilis]|nr:hypothetical protein [Gemmiger formicilis]
MEAARAADVKLLHLCTPPVSAAEVYTAVTEKRTGAMNCPSPRLTTTCAAATRRFWAAAAITFAQNSRNWMILRALCAVGGLTHAELSACHLEHCMAEG